MTMRITVLGLAALLAASPLAAADLSELPGWMSGAWEQDRLRWGLVRRILVPAARRPHDRRGAYRQGHYGVTVFEHMRIIQKDDGTLVFFAQPFGRPAAEFPMVDRGNATIEFANPAHDYPQRIRYWREGDRLRARISRMDGSNAEEWDYGPMGRALE